MPKPKGPKVELPEELVAEIGDAGKLAPEAEPEASPEAPESSSLESELEEAKDRHLRLAAEFENFKRRALKERQDLFNYANENLIKELLPTVDNLERALEHARQAGEGDDVAKFLEGVELTYRSLMQVLEKIGVQVVDGKDEPFDPQAQEAIRQVPSTEHEPGTVVEIYQRGYLLKDRLLRPALVGVASPRSSESE